jgi:hypothetical protein
VRYFDHQDDEEMILYATDDAVVANAISNPILIGAAQPFRKDLRYLSLGDSVFHEGANPGLDIG